VCLNNIKTNAQAKLGYYYGLFGFLKSTDCTIIALNFNILQSNSSNKLVSSFVAVSTIPQAKAAGFIAMILVPWQPSCW